VHERECAHSGVIRDAGAIFESYKADVRDPNMELANNLCSWLKRYLWRFTGMSHGQHTKSYLNWYVYLFGVNQVSDR